MRKKITDAAGLPFRAESRVTDTGADARCSCGFQTSGWATKRLAEERMAQHQEEHRTNQPTPELEEFRQAHGLSTPAPEPTIDWED